MKRSLVATAFVFAAMLVSVQTASAQGMAEYIQEDMDDLMETRQQSTFDIIAGTILVNGWDQFDGDDVMLRLEVKWYDGNSTGYDLIDTEQWRYHSWEDEYQIDLVGYVRDDDYAYDVTGNYEFLVELFYWDGSVWRNAGGPDSIAGVAEND